MNLGQTVILGLVVVGLFGIMTFAMVLDTEEPEIVPDNNCVFVYERPPTYKYTSARTYGLRTVSYDPRGLGIKDPLCQYPPRAPERRSFETLDELIEYLNETHPNLNTSPIVYQQCPIELASSRRPQQIFDMESGKWHWSEK